MMNDDDRRNDYVNDGLNGRTAQGQQTVYCQERPALWMIKMIRSMRVFRIIWSVVLFALLVCIIIIKWSFMRGLLLAAFLLLAGVWPVIRLFEKERIRSRITNEGIRTRAVLVELSGRQYDIIYNPECPAAVMYAGMENSSAGSIVAAVAGLAVVFMAAFGVLLLSFFNLRTSEVREGDQIQIKWANTYEKSDFTQADVDSDTVQWICAAYAIYTQYNDKELGVVGGVAEDDETKDYAIRMALSGGWNITDRDSAISVLTRLLNQGQRQSYRELTEEMQKNGYMDLSEEMMRYRMNDPENRYTYSAAYRAWKAYGEHGLDGWDYCRALQVLGDCYQVGYINLEECLDQSLVIAKTLQGLYGSWEELAMSYLYGYQFWKNDDMKSSVSDSGARMEIYEILKERLEGPYSLP